MKLALCRRIVRSGERIASTPRNADELRTALHHGLPSEHEGESGGKREG